MLNLTDSIRSQCPDVSPALIQRHFASLSNTYFERYSAAEVARHLRLLGQLTIVNTVKVEIRPLAAQVFEMIVVGEDHSGTLACITAALAANGFDLEDVQVSPYLNTGGEAFEGGEPRYFVIVLRVSGQLRNQTLSDLSEDLRERLQLAFAHLAQGDILAAQNIAASGETRVSPTDGMFATPNRTGALSGGRGTSCEGLLLGGDFRLQRKLASGGICEVYQAVQISLNRTVAVKLFHQAGATDSELFARFNQEAVVLAKFSCASIVQILAAGTITEASGGLLGWMAMEYMGGGDLAQYLQRQGPPLCEIGTRWFQAILEGLQYAHRHGILHRDLKPHNLLLTGEGAIKVSDFGLLKQVQQPAQGLTARSVIMGTPHYMSPEQAIGDPLDERSDIFSLGTTFFHVFTGRLPFNRTTSQAVLVQIAQEDAPRLSEIAPHLPGPLSIIIGRMMARNRDERYQDVGVILEDLASYERRGLLTIAEGNASMPPHDPDWSHEGEETQAYYPPVHGAQHRAS